MLHLGFLPHFPVIGWMFLLATLIFGYTVALTAGRGSSRARAQNAERWFCRALLLLSSAMPLIVIEGVVIGDVALRSLLLGLSLVLLLAYIYALGRSIAYNLNRSDRYKR